jgi:hypothetical protein
MLAGCFPFQARYQTVSSGFVGCAPDDIQIVNERSGVEGMSWEALCNGHRFFCSRVDERSECTEALAPASGKDAAPATPEPAATPAS